MVVGKQQLFSTDWILFLFTFYTAPQLFFLIRVAISKFPVSVHCVFLVYNSRNVPTQYVTPRFYMGKQINTQITFKTVLKRDEFPKHLPRQVHIHHLRWALKQCGWWETYSVVYEVFFFLNVALTHLFVV